MVLSDIALSGDNAFGSVTALFCNTPLNSSS